MVKIIGRNDMIKKFVRFIFWLCVTYCLSNYLKRNYICWRVYHVKKCNICNLQMVKNDPFSISILIWDHTMKKFSHQNPWECASLHFCWLIGDTINTLFIFWHLFVIINQKTGSMIAFPWHFPIICRDVLRYK